MSQPAASVELTQAIKEVALRGGAAIVGVAPIERYDPQPPYGDVAPRGHDPRDFVPEARSVITFAQPLMNPVVDAPAALADVDIELVPPDIKYSYLEVLYNVTGHRTQDYFLEFIGQMVGQYLLAQGYDSMIFPTTGIHPRSRDGRPEREIWQGPSRTWSDMYSPFRYSPGPFSHRHAATRAGLGEFGYNNIVLTPQFGPRQRFNSVITDAPLVADPLIDQPICLRDSCLLCQKACIMQAITMRDDPQVRDYRSVELVDKNRIFIDTPAKTDPVLCNSRRDRIPNSPIRGDCYRICPVPKERTHLPKRLQVFMDEWKAEGGIV